MEHPTKKLILVWHGETAANVAGRMQGRTNDPLTERCSLSIMEFRTPPALVTVNDRAH